MSEPTKNIFIFAYYSFKDPVFQSAVLPYFLDFPFKDNFNFVLVTFEQKKYRTITKERKQISKLLSENNILWHNFNWHSGTFKLLKKGYDFISALVFCSFLIRKYKIKAIYSEGFPGAIFGYHLSQIFNIPHIVHTFEPHADYMVEAGVWQDNAWEARLLRSYEKKIATSAAHIMTGTQAMIERIQSLGGKARLHRVPSCVDVNVFNYSEKHRNEIRNRLEITDEECLIVYLGKFGGMYMEEEIFQFFSICQRSPQKFKFLILTPEDHSRISEFFAQNDISDDKFIIKTLQRKEIPDYLSAADFGLVPVRQNPSKRYCSPIKDGEYWACGLPILIFHGISDDYEFAKKNRIGIVIEDTTATSYTKAVEEIVSWINTEDPSLVRKRCRGFVKEDRDILRYQALYADIFSRL